ncbi:hypothetical protein [Streptomyces sp. NPDC010273]|uniref:hypothetical protein n=1 Tax=Streptomyces sp. NPDC010273 TaxID=3364829 RepID=UPI0036EDD9AD
MGVVGSEVLLAAPTRDVPSIPVRGDAGVIADALVPFEPASLVVGYGEEVIGGFMADPRQPLAARGVNTRWHSAGSRRRGGGSSRWVEPVGRVGRRGSGAGVGSWAMDPVSLAGP